MAKILVVDDEEMERALIRDIFRPGGHDLLFASEGETALEICRLESPDLVVTDLAMPDFNGLRFIRELREAGLSIPVIAVSGWAADQLDLAEDYGANVTLFKPLIGQELLDAADKIFDRSNLSRRGDLWGHAE